MKDYKFPLLEPYQIECRVGQVTEKGCTLLLYKTSRTDAEILDSVVGKGNWQKKFYTLQGVGIGNQVRSIVVCSVGIYDDDKKEWIWKDDSGTESQVEQDKGICSDSFKRAAGGSCWGIGRELYYTGFIFVRCGTKAKSNDKGYELVDKYATYSVKEIKWNENPLTLKSLAIINDKSGDVVYSYGNSSPKIQYEEKPQVDTQTVLKDRTELYAIVLKKYGDDVGTFNSWLSRKYSVGSLKELPDDKVGEVLAIMRKAKQ